MELIGNRTEEPEEEREILKTQSMIEDSFFKNLQKSGSKVATQIGETAIEKQAETSWL